MESAIVSELGKEFNVDEIYKEESSFIGSLVSVEDFRHVEVPPHFPLHLDGQMAEDTQPQEVTQEEDQAMACEDNDAVETKSGNSKKQNAKLYTAEGILDPRIRRAEKKRRKAHKASMMDADYDFKVDYVTKVVSADDKEDEADDKSAEGDNNGDDRVDGSASMSGVELEA